MTWMNAKCNDNVRGSEKFVMVSIVTTNHKTYLFWGKKHPKKQTEHSTSSNV